MRTSTTTTRLLKAAAIGAALLLGSLGIAGTAAAAKAPSTPGTATWNGNGTTVTAGTRTLNTVTCDANDTPYLLWVLAGSKATTATINIDGGDPISMGKPGIDKKTGISTFKYTMTGSVDLDTLTASAAYNDGKNKATLTISHGCLGPVDELPCIAPADPELALVGDIRFDPEPSESNPGRILVYESNNGSCDGEFLFELPVVEGDEGGCTALVDFSYTVDPNWYICVG
jgi:hypothetical protein